MRAAQALAFVAGASLGQAFSVGRKRYNLCHMVFLTLKTYMIIYPIFSSSPKLFRKIKKS